MVVGFVQQTPGGMPTMMAFSNHPGQPMGMSPAQAQANAAVLQNSMQMQVRFRDFSLFFPNLYCGWSW